MQPITRKEIYLAKMSGDYSGNVPEPVTRMDYYMAYAAGAYSGPLPKPIRQQEFYWAYICGATDIELPAPVTRIDMYLAATCGGMILLPEPITREKIYLSKIAKQSEAVVKSAVGKTIVLTDSLEAPFEDFHIYGHTTQETTTGAQLFDKDRSVAIFGANIEWLETGFRVSGAARRGGCECVLPVKPQTEHYFSVGIKNNSSNANAAPRVFIYLCADQEGPGDLYNTVTGNVKDLKISTGAFEYARFVFAYNWITGDPLDDETGDATFDGIILSLSTALPWEPYTGGQPSPTPDYPQELVSAGDKGSVEIVVSGSQLIDFERANLSQCTLQDSDTGTIQSEIVNGYFCSVFVDYLKDCFLANLGKSFSFTVNNNPTGKKISIVVHGTRTSGLIFQEVSVTGNKCTITLANDFEAITNIELRVNRDPQPFEDTKTIISGLMLYEGVDDKSYEPYCAQTLTLSTPNGLPGIPVSSGGNYTDESDQQWVCDEIDFGRGVYVQMVGKETFDGSEDELWIASGNYNKFRIELSAAAQMDEDGFGLLFCTHFAEKNASYFDSQNILGCAIRFNTFYIKFGSESEITSKELLMMWLQDNPITLYYVLAEPIETPIPADELAAYRALHTNYPTTTITNDGDCWMEVEYKAKPISQYSEAMTLEYLKGE